MLVDFFPFQFSIDTTAIAGIALWSLALYLGFWSWGDWTIEQLNRWFNFAERSLYTSAEEFERTRKGREAQNAFYASLFSIIPFIVAGTACSYLIELSFGSASWTISLGTIACISGGIYELGRRDSQGESDE
ncbi:MAG: hypothetical protein SWY16_21355 [Cyanobacteriota bacterium]|nr:hypothetical protein [Cyanobacteriota bacterium]